MNCVSVVHHHSCNQMNWSLDWPQVKMSSWMHTRLIGLTYENLFVFICKYRLNCVTMENEWSAFLSLEGVSFYYYRLWTIWISILDFYGAVVPLKWRQMMELLFWSACCTEHTQNIKRLFSMQFVYDIFMGFKLKT